MPRKGSGHGLPALVGPRARPPSLPGARALLFINSTRHYLFAVAIPRTSSTWALVPGALLFVLLAWQLDFLCDDAFISFRYSRNLAEGAGLRYNLGSATAVEGYSNFLWVLWLSVFEAIGTDPGLASRMSSAACGLLLVIWVPALAARRLGLDALGSACVGLFLGSLPAFALWATGGLATMPTALLLFGLFAMLLGDPAKPRGLGAAAFASATILMRADGALWVAMLWTCGLLLWWLDGRSKALRRALLQVAVISALVLAAHLAWRLSYYGEWLPNTARIKVGVSRFRLSRGFDYVVTWWLAMPATLLVVAAALRSRMKDQLNLALPAWVILTGSLGYALWVGGDFMPFGRFVFSATPFLALLLALCLRPGSGSSADSRDQSRPRPWALAVGGLAVLLNLACCFGHNPVPRAWRAPFHFRLNSEWKSELEMRAAMQARTEDWTRLGKALALATQPEQSMILAGIGAIGYHSRLQILDRYGLVTPEVIEHAEPRENASPGHDIEVPTTYFYGHDPSIGGAFFAGVNAPPDYNLPPGWAQHPISKMTTIERHALPEGQGFAPGVELRLIRFKGSKP